MTKWSEKIPKEALDFLILQRTETAPARQRICTLQVHMQTKIEQSPSEMLVEAQRNFLMAMKRLRCVRQTVICLWSSQCRLRALGVATVRRLPSQVGEPATQISVAVRRTRRETPYVDGYFSRQK